MKFFIAVVLCTIWGASFSQQLEIGQEVPALRVSGVVNHTSRQLKLSDYKGKLVILDFWGLTCSSCIAAFPKLDALQKKYADQVQIIAVNRESEKVTKKFFSDHSKIKMPGIPFVTGDTLLKKYFPSKFYPWHVWIDKDGIVRHIAQGYNATGENVQAFLDGKKLDIIELRYQTPAELSEARSASTPLQKADFYSFIVRYEPVSTIRNSQRTDSATGKLVRFSRHGVTVLQLFKHAFEENHKYHFQVTNPWFTNNVILNVKDTFRYVFPTDPQKYDWWYANYGYDYEIKVPVSMSDQIFKIMQQDLQRFFGLNAKVENRKVKCLVLEKISGENKFMTAGATPESNWGVPGQKERTFVNQPFQIFFSFLTDLIDYQNLTTPLVDGTKYEGNIDFSIKSDDLTNLEAIKTTLLKYNLQLIEKEFSTDVLVISDEKEMQEIFER